jgi:hypothetical protein
MSLIRQIFYDPVVLCDYRFFHHIAVEGLWHWGLLTEWGLIVKASVFRSGVRAW